MFHSDGFRNQETSRAKAVDEDAFLKEQWIILIYKELKGYDSSYEVIYEIRKLEVDYNTPGNSL